MRRREFMALIGGAAAWPLTARAQQQAMPVVGYLESRSQSGDAPFRAAFHQGLNEAGYVEGKNVIIEYRWAEFQYDRLAALARELISRRVSVLFAATLQSARAAKAATATIPIVFAIGSDPVEFNLVASFNRPGGNVMGARWLGTSLAAKQLELLHEVTPKSARIAAIINQTNPASDSVAKDLEQAARLLGLQIVILNASNERDVSAAFASLDKHQVDGLLISGDVFLTEQRQQLVDLAAQHALPAIYPFSEFVKAGGLMSYGGSYAGGYRQAGNYTGRILDGEQPADLPVIQATKVELAINFKTAKTLGLTFPLSLLGRSDEVIE
jgi:putative tryptophan/tyrosine transport system substrate-binding protein